MKNTLFVPKLPKLHQYDLITNPDKKPNAKVAFDTLQPDQKMVSSNPSHASTISNPSTFFTL